MPEAHTDMIMAVVGEELGAVGFLLVVGLLDGGWCGRCFHVASARARLCSGCWPRPVSGTMFASADDHQHRGGRAACCHAKGLVLPFMSYGASAAVVNVLGVGVVLKVAMQAHAGAGVGHAGAL